MQNYLVCTELSFFDIQCFPELRSEIERLRNSGITGNDTVYASSLAEISTLKDKLQEKEKEMEEINR